jgi:hypothetical protein
MLTVVLPVTGQKLPFPKPLPPYHMATVFRKPDTSFWWTAYFDGHGKLILPGKRGREMTNVSLENQRGCVRSQLAT